MFAEGVVADDRGKRSAAEHAELFFVNFLEHRALIELRRALQIAQQFALGAVEDLDLQHIGGFRLIHHVLQAAPARLQLLERLVVHDFVQLKRQQVVDLRDTGVDGGFRVAGDRHLALQNLVYEFTNQALASLIGLGDLAFRADLIEQRGFENLFLRLRLGALSITHCRLPCRARPSALRAPWDPWRSSSELPQAVRWSAACRADPIGAGGDP